MRADQRALAEGALFTDMYQLTMAQLYFRHGLHELRAQFDAFFRSYPDYGEHQAGYCINAGLESALDWLSEARFTALDTDHLRREHGRTGTRLFHDDFLAWLLERGSFDAISMNAVPEGRVVHPTVPVAVVYGPLALAQILETPLLNSLAYETLVATKAARVREAAGDATIMEFGMRRAHSRGATAGARAALIGGADFTSNTGASIALGLPPKGTHAHSMVQAFMALGESELEAFRAYAELYPDDCLLLVDTVDTLGSGVPNAIKVFEELRRRGHDPMGIRLDSGDLAHLAVEAARMLDAAGFPDASIVLSNQLDELVIWQILTQIRREATRHGVDADAVVRRLVYGVGTRLITSRGDSALDGVYKLVAIEDDGALVPAIKLSETPAKTLNPGDKRVWRVYDTRGKASADVLAREDEPPPPGGDGATEMCLHHPSQEGVTRVLHAADVSAVEALLEPVLDAGREVAARPSLEAIRTRRVADLDRLDDGVRRLMNPHIYHVSLSDGLWQTKRRLIERLRQGRDATPPRR